MGFQGATTKGAGILKTRDGIPVPGPEAAHSACLTLKERGSPLHREEGNKKKGEVVIYPFEMRPVQAAFCTHPGMVFKDYPLGLNPCNKKAHRDGISTSTGVSKDNVGEKCLVLKTWTSGAGKKMCLRY